MNKYITCPGCGEKIPLTKSSSGRKPLNIPVTTIYDALRLTRSIPATAKELGCSRAYIYKVLKEQGKTLEEVLRS